MLGKKEPEMLPCAAKEFLPRWVVNVVFLEVGRRCFLSRGQISRAEPQALQFRFKARGTSSVVQE